MTASGDPTRNTFVPAVPVANVLIPKDPALPIQSEWDAEVKLLDHALTLTTTATVGVLHFYLVGPHPMCPRCDWSLQEFRNLRLGIETGMNKAFLRIPGAGPFPQKPK